MKGKKIKKKKENNLLSPIYIKKKGFMEQLGILKRRFKKKSVGWALILLSHTRTLAHTHIHSDSL
jgi:hypothetical protein